MSVAPDAAADSSADPELVEIARYVCDAEVGEPEALSAARICLLDALACALEALSNHECARLLGPIVPGAELAGGARVPGTAYELDPATATFSIGCMIRWLDLNDSFTGASATHPSDAVSGLLAVADYLGRQPGARSLRVRELLEYIVKVYEIQGCLALGNTTFGNAGYLDHVLLEKVATAAVVARMLGGSRDVVQNATSNAWLEPCLRLYRQSSGAGSRKNWAAADACAQGVRLAYLAIKGEMGYPHALSAAKHGFCDAFRGGEPLQMVRPYGTYVIRNTALKAVPSAMYGQSAAECAFLAHPHVRDRLERIERITVHTHAGVFRIMDRKEPLLNAADRDHCIQYVIAIGLIAGALHAEDFEDAAAADPRIDALRDRMVLVEDPRFTAEFSEPSKRSSATGLEVRFDDGTTLPRIDVEYPSGHPRRRAESGEAFQRKFADAVARRFPPERAGLLVALCSDQARFEAASVVELMTMLVAPPVSN